MTILSEIEGTNHVLVVDLVSKPHLTEESLNVVLSKVSILSKDLYSDRRFSEDDILSEVHGRHTSRTKWTDNPIPISNNVTVRKVW
jgi:hypothetical protein